MISDFIKINKYSSIPLYEQIKTGLLEAIQNQHLTAGEKLPTEEELCKAFGISRPVVRQAYNDLTKSGVIYRERGKGTFVKEVDNRGLFLHRILSYDEEMAIVRKKPGTKLISADFIPYDANLFYKLGLTEEGRCLRIERMRYANDKPFEHIVNYVPADRFEGIENHDFSKESLYQCLRKEHNIQIIRAHRSLKARKAASSVAKYLEIPKNSTILIIESTVYDQYEKPVEVSIESVSGDSNQYDFDVYNN